VGKIGVNDKILKQNPKKEKISILREFPSEL